MDCISLGSVPLLSALLTALNGALLALFCTAKAKGATSCRGNWVWLRAGPYHGSRRHGTTKSFVLIMVLLLALGPGQPSRSGLRPSRAEAEFHRLTQSGEPVGSAATSGGAQAPVSGR